jgi:outer membrane protein assembly factor BamB
MSQLGITTRRLLCRLAAVLGLLLLPLSRGGTAEDAPAWVAQLEQETGAHGGLCVLVGMDDPAMALDLSARGTFLVKMLSLDPTTVERASARIQEAQRYGLVCADELRPDDRLPFTENLVNLLLMEGRSATPAMWREAARVVCPGGTVLVRGITTPGQAEAAGLENPRTVQFAEVWLAARKPRPGDMDEWSHARHSSTGNAVSTDTLVGPPRRVRWVVGAESEVAGMVTSGGRNYYAAALARDSFNGLRLWNRDFLQPESSQEFVLRNVPANVPTPVAAGPWLYVISAGKLLALDGATGKTVREYPEAGNPQSLLHDRGLLLVADGESVRAVDSNTGDLLWKHTASAPRQLVCGDDFVGVMQGDPRRGEQLELLALDRSTGRVLWTKQDPGWATRVYRCVYHQGLLAYEVSTVNDDGPGNALHILSAADGHTCWERDFLPGMNHMRQARAMFVGDRLWLLHGGKSADKERLPIECSAFDPLTGQTFVTHPAGLTHCFPPVATTRFLFAGEMDLTDLATGKVDANRITKAACGRESGWVPANGLIYVTPKHCVCWPMLRGYAALAPERPDGNSADRPLGEIEFALERGSAAVPAVNAEQRDSDWPCYRHDAWRSGSTAAPGPTELNTLWTVDLSSSPATGPIIADWQENPFIKGPLTAPVVASHTVIVARPDAHEVVALDALTGAVRWRFTASGRVDTAPTLHAGLVLFGTKNGFVYCLRADDGQIVWRRSAAPTAEQIVAYGQLESPWPVPGSVLVSEGVAYFAAGRQPLADGGIFVFAVLPASGELRWVQRLDSVPQQGFYECSALEFDNFDLLYRQGDGVAMSRWAFDISSGKMSVDRWSAFARLNTGNGESLVPRGSWSYAPRHQKRIPADSALKPLAVFRDATLLGGVQGMQSVFRRDFAPDEVAAFNTQWMTGWAAGQAFSAGERPWPNDRLAEKASWRVDLYDPKTSRDSVEALVMAGDRLYAAASSGELRMMAIDRGTELARVAVPAPVWDGMAVAHERLFLSTSDGHLLCLGKK